MLSKKMAVSLTSLITIFALAFVALLRWELCWVMVLRRHSRSITGAPIPIRMMMVLPDTGPGLVPLRSRTT